MKNYRVKQGLFRWQYATAFSRKETMRNAVKEFTLDLLKKIAFKKQGKKIDDLIAQELK